MSVKEKGRLRVDATDLFLPRPRFPITRTGLGPADSDQRDYSPSKLLLRCQWVKLGDCREALGMQCWDVILLAIFPGDHHLGYSIESVLGRPLVGVCCWVVTFRREGRHGLHLAYLAFDE
jgi:hypothetical protein